MAKDKSVYVQLDGGLLYKVTPGTRDKVQGCFVETTTHFTGFHGRTFHPNQTVGSFIEELRQQNYKYPGRVRRLSSLFDYKLAVMSDGKITTIPHVGWPNSGKHVIMAVYVPPGASLGVKAGNFFAMINSP